MCVCTCVCVYVCVCVCACVCVCVCVHGFSVCAVRMCGYMCIATSSMSFPFESVYVEFLKYVVFNLCLLI